MDVMEVLFSFIVLQQLMAVIYFTNCFATDGNNPNSSLQSGRWALKNLDLADFQFVLPRLKYISKESKTTKRRDLDDLIQEVSDAPLSETVTS